jgi:hypothetical protein
MIRKTCYILVLAVAALILWKYVSQMILRGGFDLIPADTPLPAIRVVKKEVMWRSTPGKFSFAVLGDMRWDSAPRIATLEHAQSKRPLFMVNLADVVEYSRKDEWERYISELRTNWNRDIPYYHVPGSHSLNVRLGGVYPAFFRHYFGKTFYSVDIASWRFIFLDTSYGFVPKKQRRWLSARLEDARRRSMRSVLFMHFPPRVESKGITHAMKVGGTNRFADVINGFDIAAIFSAHMHDVVEYTWNGIPVFITSFNASTWKTKPAAFRLVTIDGRRLNSSTILVSDAAIPQRPEAEHVDIVKNTREKRGKVEILPAHPRPTPVLLEPS